MKFESAPSIEIRNLTIADVPLHAVPRGHEFVAENPNFDGRPFAAEAFTAQWSYMIETGFGRVIGAWQEDVMIGALGFYLTENPFVGGKVASEAFWFVSKPFRKSIAGMAMFEEFERQAAEAGCVELLMVHLCGEGLPNLTKVYERFGYRMVEQTFRKTLTPKA